MRDYFVPRNDSANIRGLILRHNLDDMQSGSDTENITVTTLCLAVVLRWFSSKVFLLATQGEKPNKVINWS